MTKCPAFLLETAAAGFAVTFVPSALLPLVVGLEAAQRPSAVAVPPPLAAVAKPPVAAEAAGLLVAPVAAVATLLAVVAELLVAGAAAAVVAAAADALALPEHELVAHEEAYKRQCEIPVRTVNLLKQRNAQQRT